MPDEKPNTPPATPVLETIIPEEFRDRTYLNDLKSLPVGPDGFKALFKKLDGAQTLIGKKTGIPEANATPEEVEKFYASLRPAKAEEYELPAPEAGKQADPEMTKFVQGMFHEAGLSKAQAAKVMAKFGTFAQEKLAAQNAESLKQDEEFKALTEKAFGADNAKVLERSKALLTELTPPAMAPFLNKLPNESLVLLAGVMEGVRAKFMKEDNLNGNGGDGAPVDAEAMRKEARDLQMSPAWKDAFHPDHAKTIAKVNELYTKIGRTGKK